MAVYGVAFAVCLAMGGRLGDNLGRRTLFLWGVRIFAVASLMCGLANSVWLLLVARVLQGVGAAFIVPQILATIHVCLRGREHTKALGMYGAIGGLAFIVGQVLGGLLITLDIAGSGWRSVFLINIPVCLLVLACAHRWVPNTRGEKRVNVDLPGTLLLGLTIACLLFRWHWGRYGTGRGLAWCCWRPASRCCGYFGRSNGDRSNGVISRCCRRRCCACRACASGW
ncbi:Methyl viologen resistance protein SmvA [Serratia plymuthica]|uniref:Methyl viologen resistance protein SmvA n=1 Tax=Serratia plymuthica TaxID=82996 RepID=A0A2X4TTI1_SERPL|nr:Methyl viologen resistance protein SmvA [Serratia plymuthica]